MDNVDGAIRAFFNDPALQKRLAKYLVQRCFRNSALEDLHAGTAPDSKAGDYSDVVVVTPFGEIPWRRLSRFDDGEMKTLMIDVVQRVYEFIQELFDEELGANLLLRLAERDPLSGRTRSEKAHRSDCLGGCGSNLRPQLEVRRLPGTGRGV
jgi:hypothetical protein